MIVLSLTDCPAGLRGDLTKWLLEIDSGVFVGQISARVRDELWGRVKETCRHGRAILVFSTNNEQRLDFRVHNAAWEPIDFDGIKLMLRPSSARLKAKAAASAVKHGFSNAAKRRAAQRFSAARTRYPVSYVVIDLETTGLDRERDGILEFGAVKVTERKRTETFQSLVRVGKPVPDNITQLTGITEEMTLSDGKPLNEALAAFLVFIGDMPVVAHNADFDAKFLISACAKCSLPLFSNRCIDTLTLARKLIHGLPDYKLGTLAERLGIAVNDAHRSIADCEVTAELYEKLMDLLDGEQ